MLVREVAKWLPWGELARDRLLSFRGFISRRSGPEAGFTDWNLLFAAFDLLIDMSEAIEATGHSYRREHEEISAAVAHMASTRAA